MASAQPAFSFRDRLGHLPYFRALAPARVEALARHATCRHFAAQETILLQGERHTGLWVIESGHVKIFRLSADGREHILHLPGPGDSFNDIPPLDGGPAAAHAVALTPVIAWMLPPEALMAELRADPELAIAVIEILSGRMRDLVQQIEDLALCSVTARLARYLLKQSDAQTPNGPSITRATLAAHLATTPETVSRALRALEQLGSIRFDRHEIAILRPDLLHAVAME